LILVISAVLNCEYAQNSAIWTQTDSPSFYFLFFRNICASTPSLSHCTNAMKVDSLAITPQPCGIQTCYMRTGGEKNSTTCMGGQNGCCSIVNRSTSPCATSRSHMSLRRHVWLLTEQNLHATLIMHFKICQILTELWALRNDVHLQVY
jgi:hypothetical protein